MEHAIKSALIVLTVLFSYGAIAQSASEVALVAHSTIDVKYKGKESYIAYLTQRGISKENVFSDYYTGEFVFDLGKVKAGETRDIKIPFKNVSDTYIKITAVNEICPCLIAEFPMGDAIKFKPGETKVGKVKFSSKGLSGKIRRAVEVRTYTNLKEINYLVWIQADVIK